MKCPKYIEKAIERRRKLAEDLSSVDLMISRWCEENEVETEMVHLHVAIICEPSNAARIILEDIENAGRPAAEMKEY